MMPHPIALGVTLCEKVIIEEGAGKYQVSLLIDGEWLTNRDLQVLLKKA